MKELTSYLKLFNNYERRFKHITILIPLNIYEKFKGIIEEHAAQASFIKYGEQSEVVIFRNWS